MRSREDSEERVSFAESNSKLMLVRVTVWLTIRQPLASTRPPSSVFGH